LIDWLHFFCVSRLRAAVMLLSLSSSCWMCVQWTQLLVMSHAVIEDEEDKAAGESSAKAQTSTPVPGKRTLKNVKTMFYVGTEVNLLVLCAIIMHWHDSFWFYCKNCTLCHARIFYVIMLPIFSWHFCLNLTMPMSESLSLHTYWYMYNVIIILVAVLSLATLLWLMSQTSPPADSCNLTTHLWCPWRSC